MGRVRHKIERDVPVKVWRYFRDWFDTHEVLNLDEIYEDVARPDHPLHGRYFRKEDDD